MVIDIDTPMSKIENMFHEPQIFERNNHRTYDKLDFLVREELFYTYIVSNLFLTTTKTTTLSVLVR